MKKNIITKILLSSFMLPSLMGSAVPTYAAPGDPNEQLISANLDDYERTQYNQFMEECPEISDFIAFLEADYLRDGVLDLSKLSYNDLALIKCTSFQCALVYFIDAGKLKTIKFSYKQLYEETLNRKLFDKKTYDYSSISNIIDQTFGMCDKINIAFDYIVPFMPHPTIPNKVIDMGEFYHRIQQRQKIICDSIIIYTTPSFSVYDWLMKAFPVPKGAIPGKWSLLHTFDDINSTDVNGNKLNHIVICGEPNTEDNNILSVRNVFESYYGYVPTIEFNDSINFRHYSSSSTYECKLEPVYLTHVLPYLQSVDDDKLTLQQNFNCVSKNTNEAVEMLKTTSPGKFIHHDYKTLRKSVPNIESFTLTEDDLLSLFKNPSCFNELHRKWINTSATLKKVTIDIKPFRVVYYRGNPFLSDCNSIRMKPEWIRRLLLELKKKGLTIEFRSLVVESSQGEICDPISREFLNFAKANEKFIKFLYIQNRNSTDSNIIEFIKEYNPVINSHTVIILEKPIDKDSVSAIRTTFPGIKIVSKNQLASELYAFEDYIPEK